MIGFFKLTFLHSGIISEYLKISSFVMIMRARKNSISFSICWPFRVYLLGLRPNELLAHDMENMIHS